MYALVKDGEFVTKDGKIVTQDQPPNVNQKLLAPSKPRWVEVQEPSFNPAIQVREGPVMNGDTATYTIRDKDADELAAMKAKKVAKIKAEAQKRILAIMPQEKQINMLALGQETLLAYGPNAKNWPQKLQATMTDSLNKWEAIKAIRAKSDEMEASLAGMTDAIDVATYEPEWE